MGILRIDFAFAGIIWLYVLGGIGMCVTLDRMRHHRDQKLREKTSALFDNRLEDGQQRVERLIRKNIQNDLIFVHAFESYMAAVPNYSGAELYHFNSLMQDILGCKRKSVQLGDKLRLNMLETMETALRSTIERDSSVAVLTFEKTALPELAHSYAGQN